jgi:hypothetical protein
MNPFPWLSLVTPAFPESASNPDAGSGSAHSSSLQIVQWWLQISSPLPSLPIRCSLLSPQTVPAPQTEASESPAAQPAPHSDVLHVIAIASPAELQNLTIEYSVRLASATAARLTVTPLAISDTDPEADQQLRLRLAQTDYRTLPHGVRITGPVRQVSAALADSTDSHQFTVLLLSARDLTAIDHAVHGLPQLLLLPGVAILAHAEPEHE